MERVAVGLRKGQMAGGKKQIINFSLRLCVTRFTINMVGAVWHIMRIMCLKVYITFYKQLPFHGRVPVGGGCAMRTDWIGKRFHTNDLELKPAQTK